MFGFFPLFLDGEQKKDGKGKPRGRRGTQQLEKGTEQAFIDLAAHILGSVKSNYRLFVDIYIISHEKVNYC